MNPTDAIENKVKTLTPGTLPNPLYRVELVKEGRKRFYQATAHDGSWQHNYQGTTGISGMLDDGKSFGFAKAASGIAVEAVRAKLLKVGPEPIVLEPEVIDGLLAGCATAYQKEWNAKRDRGTDYHELLEARFRGLPYTTTPDFEEMWAKLQDKLHAEAIDIVSAEVPCASIIHKFGTKVDGVGKLMGDWGVVDWKTSRFTSSEHFFQVGGGSAQAFTETYGVTAKWAKILRWDFAGKYWEVKTIINLERALSGLLALRQVKDTIEEELFI